MERAPSPALRRCWFLLWALGAGLILLLLVATLSDRPFDDLALRHFPADALERGRQFSREVRLAVTAQSLLGLGALLWLCFARGGARVLTWLEGLGRGRTWLGLIAVTAGVTLVQEAVGLPLAYYLGFVHERAYGLSKLTAEAWFLGYLRSLGIQLALTLLLWLPLYWLIRRWPRGWWLPAAAMNVAFSGLLVVAAPLLFLPLQGEVVPVKDPRLLAMVQRVADRAGVAVEEVRELKAGARTNRVNAMVIGLGMTKQVVFYDTLLERFSPKEVEVVVAHEMAHAIHRDVATGWLLGAGLETLVLIGAAWMMRSSVGVGPLLLPAPHAARGVALLLLFGSLAGQLTGPVQNAVSRQMEVRADRFALAMTGDPDAFVRTFKKLAAGNIADVDPPLLVELLSHSHPSIIHRIRMVE